MFCKQGELYGMCDLLLLLLNISLHEDICTRTHMQTSDGWKCFQLRIVMYLLPGICVDHAYNCGRVIIDTWTVGEYEITISLTFHNSRAA